MINIKFYTDIKKSSGKKDVCYLIVAVTVDGKRYMKNVGGGNFPINSWSRKQQKFKTSLKNASELNRELEKTRTEIMNDISVIPMKERKPEIIKAVIENVLKPNTIKKRNINDVLDEYINNSDKANNTIKHYKTLQNHLLNFKPNLKFSEINFDFGEDFMRYLRTKKNPLSNTALQKMITILKTFLIYCYRKGLIDLEFKDFLKAPKIEDTNIVVLTKDEIDLLWQYEPENQRLQNTKLLFMVLIYVGIRYSDLANLCPENFNFDNWHITINTVKTKDNLTLPIHPKIRKMIFDKKGFLPKISNQKFNVYIKELCRLAGIDKPTQHIYYNGTQRIQEVKPKYELITTHIGRRSFCTRLVQNGMSTQKIRELTGHKTDKMLQKYIKLNRDDTINEFYEKF